MLVVVIVVSKIIIKPLFYYFYLLFYIIDVAIEILNENNLAVLDGCFNSIVDLTTGNVHTIPNYYFNEPAVVKEYENKPIDQIHETILDVITLLII